MSASVGSSREISITDNPAAAFQRYLAAETLAGGPVGAIAEAVNRHLTQQDVEKGDLASAAMRAIAASDKAKNRFVTLATKWPDSKPPPKLAPTECLVAWAVKDLPDRVQFGRNSPPVSRLWQKCQGWGWRVVADIGRRVDQVLLTPAVGISRGGGGGVSRVVPAVTPESAAVSGSALAALTGGRGLRDLVAAHSGDLVGAVEEALEAVAAAVLAPTSTPASDSRVPPKKRKARTSGPQASLGSGSGPGPGGPAMQ